MGATLERPACGPATQPPTGRGQRHPERTVLGARGTLVPTVQKPRVGHQPLLPYTPRGARRPCGGPAVLDGNA